MNILICDPVGQSGMDYLVKQGYKVIYRPEITEEELKTEVATVEALVVRSRTRITSEIIEAAQSLRVIGRSGAGVDTIDIGAAKQKNIVIVNAPGANTEAVAEHTLALLFGLARDIVNSSTRMSEGEWPKNSYRGIELHGKTLGVIGFGHIGSRVAQLASALGMNVSVYTRTHSQSRKDSIEAIGGRELSMDDLIRTSDFITLHVPLSDDTKNLFSAETFRKMKPISYLINTSRGAVVDEQALIFALENGIIAGAALDVFAEEPLQKDNPLCKMKSVILSPHVAANSREAEERASSMISVDIDRVLQGKAALHAV